MFTFGTGFFEKNVTKNVPYSIITQYLCRPEPVFKRWGNNGKERKVEGVKQHPPHTLTHRGKR